MNTWHGAWQKEGASEELLNGWKNGSCTARKSRPIQMRIFSFRWHQTFTISLNTAKVKSDFPLDTKPSSMPSHSLSSSVVHRISRGWFNEPSSAWNPAFLTPRAPSITFLSPVLSDSTLLLLLKGSWSVMLDSAWLSPWAVSSLDNSFRLSSRLQLYAGTHESTSLKSAALVLLSAFPFLEMSPTSQSPGWKTWSLFSTSLLMVSS